MKYILFTFVSSVLHIEANVAGAIQHTPISSESESNSADPEAGR